MARSQADLQALKDELTNDPKSFGYPGLTAENDVPNANMLNDYREVGTVNIDRESIPSSEIAKAMDRDEYIQASLADRQWIDLVLQPDFVDTSPGEVRTGLLQIFVAGSNTRTNVQGLLTVGGSRVEELHQDGTLEEGGVVTPSDVARARQLP